MAKAIEYGLILAGLALIAIGVITFYDRTKPVDPVAARYALIETECAKPTIDGSRREIVYLDDNNRNAGYVPCRRKY